MLTPFLAHAGKSAGFCAHAGEGCAKLKRAAEAVAEAIPLRNQTLEAGKQTQLRRVLS